jgi:hypothetical protein
MYENVFFSQIILVVKRLWSHAWITIDGRDYSSKREILSMISNATFQKKRNCVTISKTGIYKLTLELAFGLFGKLLHKNEKFYWINIITYQYI